MLMMCPSGLPSRFLSLQTPTLDTASISVSIIASCAASRGVNMLDKGSPGAQTDDWHDADMVVTS